MSPYWLSLSILLSYVHSQVYNNEAQTSITCTQATCQIACFQPYGCNNLTIDASQSNTLTITCSESYSCQTIRIISSAQISTEIDCTALASCTLAEFDVNNSPTVNLKCDYDSSSYLNGACRYVNLNASLSTNVNIDCANVYSCYHAKIHCPDNNNNDNNQCNITCSDSLFSCYYMDIFITSKDKGDLNLDCSTTATPCSDVDVYCGATTYAPKSDLVYTTDIGWYCSTFSCCPFYDGKINCGTTNCIVNSTTTNCFRYLIDGTAATTSLTVHCDATNGGCGGTTIICPQDAKCNINCKHANSCNGAKIIGSSSYSLDLYCSGNDACRDIDVYCPYDRRDACNIDCSSGELYVCYNMDIIVSTAFTTKYLSLLCPNTDSNYACSALFSCNYKPDTGLACSDCNVTIKTQTSLIFNDTNYEYDCYDMASSYCCPWGENTTTATTTTATETSTIATTTAATTTTFTTATTKSSIGTSPVGNNCVTYHVYKIFTFLMYFVCFCL